MDTEEYLRSGGSIHLEVMQDEKGRYSAMVTTATGLPLLMHYSKNNGFEAMIKVIDEFMTEWNSLGDCHQLKHGEDLDIDEDDNWIEMPGAMFDKDLSRMEDDNYDVEINFLDDDEEPDIGTS